MTEQPTETLARVQFNIRLPMDVHSAASEVARRTGQSMNGLLVALIREALTARHGTPVGATRAGTDHAGQRRSDGATG